MTAAQFLIDTSALARLMRPGAESFGWDQAAAAGLIAVCPVTELEFFHVVAATAELHSLTLLHHDRDFGVIARVTGQPLRWYGPD